MIKEDFVTYEQALALKKLGFKEDCLYHYYNVTKELKPNEVTEENALLGDFLMDFNYDDKYNCYISAPTLVQVQKWLRVKKRLYIYITPIISKPEERYFMCICNLVTKEEDWALCSFNSPEEALLKGITKCLKLLLEK